MKVKVPVKCLKCGADTDPADVHFMPSEDGGLKPKVTYECLACGEEYPIEEA